jgi:hypothetical protein
MNWWKRSQASVNRQRLIQRLQAGIPTELVEEMAYYMDIDHSDWAVEEGQPYDLADAFSDVMDIAESNMDRRMTNIIRRILIDVGYYIPMTEEEVAGTATMGGTQKWDFKMGGIPYMGISDWQGWLDL